jgi:hypothetical protein
VSAKTIKNKVSAPFRACNFEIHFGIGIKEHEQIFDFLRKHGSEIIDGKEIQLTGSGSWKSLIVSNEDTGEVIIEKKFFKSDFDKILDDPEFSGYCDDLLEKALIRVMSNSNSMSNFDSESYEEVRAVTIDLESDSMIDPEA